MKSRAARTLRMRADLAPLYVGFKGCVGITVQSAEKRRSGAGCLLATSWLDIMQYETGAAGATAPPRVVQAPRPVFAVAVDDSLKRPLAVVKRETIEDIEAEPAADLDLLSVLADEGCGDLVVDEDRQPLLPVWAEAVEVNDRLARFSNHRTEVPDVADDASGEIEDVGVTPGVRQLARRPRPS